MNKDQLQKKLINNNGPEPILEEILYFTRKYIGADNNLSGEHLIYIYDLEDKIKQKYHLNTYEMFYNLGLCSLYLNDLENKRQSSYLKEVFEKW